MKLHKLTTLLLVFTVISFLLVAVGFAVQQGEPEKDASTKYYGHFLNSPDVNIYWDLEKQQNTITIHGLFQNNYHTDLISVNLYIYLLDSRGKVLAKSKEFFVEIKPDQMLPFRSTFKKLKNAKKVRFSFDYNYAEWKSSVSNYGILEDNL